MTEERQGVEDLSQEEFIRDVWKRYIDYAQITGTKKDEDGKQDGRKEGLQEGYSLWWFFAGLMSREDFPQCLNPLTRAFFALDDGERAKMLTERLAECAKEIDIPSDEDLKKNYIGDSAPNESQRKAIQTAMRSPISFIQGPPGTGKTAAILNLIYQLQLQKKKVAIVSSNGATMKNIHAKLEELETAGKDEKLAKKVAELGSKANREKYSKKPESKVKFEAEKIWYCREEKDGPIICPETPPEDDWLEEHPDGMLKSIWWEKNLTVEDFFGENGFAAFTSTVNSLPSCFKDGLRYQYDYVIVDETSQMDILAGLVAMTHAKHLVLVGDEKQLAPIIRSEILEQLEKSYEAEEEYLPVDWDEMQAELYQMYQTGAWPDIFDEEGEESDIPEDILMRYMPKEDRSFLDLCLEVFLERTNAALVRPVNLADLKVFLNEHYRCHPGIIGFCNKHIYEKTPLKVCTLNYDQTVKVPIKVLRFDGNYCENSYRELNKKENGKNPSKELPKGSSKRNLRQVEIFMEEEWPQLFRRLEETEQKTGKKLSVCILSPFWGQLDAIKSAIEDAVKKARSDVTVEETAGKPEDFTEGHCLTIHKSQGQEFDIVYLLPVEDSAWEWPFSQKKRMINVAVSRAKKELRIITSKRFMNIELKPEKGESGEAFEKRKENEMFLKKLVEYVEAEATEEDKKKGFGLQDSRLVSLFDGKAFRADEMLDSISAGQKLVEDTLAKITGDLGLSWNGKDGYDREVPVEDVLREVLGKDFEKDEKFTDFLPYIKGKNLPGNRTKNKDYRATFDCVIRNRQGIPILAIEVDGRGHRFCREDMTPENFLNYQERDRKKDGIIKAMGGQVFYGNRKIPKDIWTKPAAPFAMLRLPDDGTTFLETDELREKAGRELAKKVFTLQDIIKAYAGSSDFSAMLLDEGIEEKK